VKQEQENRLKQALATAPREGAGLIDEACTLFEHLSGEVARQAERERAEAKARGPVARILFTACAVTGVIAAVTLTYGVLQFPDAPFREIRNGYAGKTGKPHTRKEYERFQIWEKALVGSFAVTFLLGFSGVAAEKLERRRRGAG